MSPASASDDQVRALLERFACPVPFFDRSRDTHTAAGIAVSCQEEGLLKISQHALKYYGHIGYHGYEGIASISTSAKALSAISARIGL